jgi:hypothetical protein
VEGRPRLCVPDAGEHTDTTGEKGRDVRARAKALAAGAARAVKASRGYYADSFIFFEENVAQLLLLAPVVVRGRAAARWW